ncbi:MAG: MoaD/ThiS family protein [Candidatus Sulfotelmatobacter sp.]
MSKIHIPTPLRQYVDKQSTVDVKASTVAEAMNALVAQHPDLRRHLYNEDGKLRAFVNLYVNDEDIRYLQKEATPLSDGDNISIVPSIAGGSESPPFRCHPERSEGPWFRSHPCELMSPEAYVG